MSAVLTKLNALQQAYDRPDDLNRGLDKLLSGALSQQCLLLARYERELREFEQRFGLASDEFYAETLTPRPPLLKRNFPLQKRGRAASKFQAPLPPSPERSFIAFRRGGGG